MDSSNLQLHLLQLRRELKEILSMIEATPRAAARPTDQQHEALSPAVHNHGSDTSTVTGCRAASAPDELIDGALVVITEFGQATPAILQMWLSIDYRRAMQILREFEAQGLVSSRGKVRHKAYALRRSKGSSEYKL